ncbi:MAG TPA: MraY family glycosyltransferase [Clostridia bacterium]
MNYILGFLIAFVIVYFSIPYLRRLALKIGFVDRPNERKIHSKPIPHLASIGMYAAFIFTYFVVARRFDKFSILLMVGSLLIIAIGLVDDLFKVKGKDFPALPKLIVQVIAAVIAYKSGAVFNGFHNPFTNQDVVLPVWLQCMLSILWIFGVTTVINFTDGMDGVAGGLSAISASTLFVVALAKNQPGSAIMSIIIVGITLGYLNYNKPPAKIFMGDAGATFLGYMLGIIALEGAFKQATIMSLFIPVLALGVPIIDNIYVVIKRIREGKPVYEADRSQIHYRLLESGLSKKQVLAMLYLLSACLSLLSIVLLLLKI